MIELIESGIDNKILVYVTVDEKQIINKLLYVKKEQAIYSNKNKVIAYQWLLYPTTVKRYFKDLQITKLMEE